MDVYKSKCWILSQAGGADGRRNDDYSGNKDLSLPFHRRKDASGNDLVRALKSRNLEDLGIHIWEEYVETGKLDGNGEC